MDRHTLVCGRRIPAWIHKSPGHNQLVDRLSLHVSHQRVGLVLAAPQLIPVSPANLAAHGQSLRQLRFGGLGALDRQDAHQIVTVRHCPVRGKLGAVVAVPRKGALVDVLRVRHIDEASVHDGLELVVHLQLGVQLRIVDKKRLSPRRDTHCERVGSVRNAVVVSDPARILPSKIDVGRLDVQHLLNGSRSCAIALVVNVHERVDVHAHEVHVLLDDLLILAGLGLQKTHGARVDAQRKILRAVVDVRVGRLLHHRQLHVRIGKGIGHGRRSRNDLLDTDHARVLVHLRLQNEVHPKNRRGGRVVAHLGI